MCLPCTFCLHCAAFVLFSAWYEIVLVNYEGQNHPYHLHGMHAMIVGCNYSEVRECEALCTCGCVQRLFFLISRSSINVSISVITHTPHIHARSHARLVQHQTALQLGPNWDPATEQIVYDPSYYGFPQLHEPADALVVADTFTVPYFGVMVLRIKADNPVGSLGG